MKAIKSGVLSMLFTISVGANEIEREVKESLDALEPPNIHLQDDVLTVTSSERRVTDKVYRAMIRGVCIGLLFRKENLVGITEI